jgi:hypothetical protein
MAITKVPVELSSTTGIVDNSNATAITIDSSENVLIGTTNTTTVGTQNRNLILGSTTNNDEVAYVINVIEGTNNRRVKFFLDDDDGVYGFDSTASTGVAPFVIRSAASEKLRIDNSGRVLIGTTSTTPGFGNTNGHAFHVGDASHISRNSGTPLIVNRGTNNGDILNFRIAGTSVGNIGSVDGDFNIYPNASGHKGLRFGNGYIAPTTNSTSVEDGTTDLGLSSQRFKRLYVSDGITDSGQAGSNTVFNENGTTADFRIESDSDTHMFFLDGGLNRVGIGTAAPRHKLSVNGTLGSSTFSGFGLGVVGGIATAESGTTNAAMGLQCTSASTSKIFAYDYAGSAGIPISIQPDNANVFICAGGGNVGIGTISPDRQLELEGQGVLRLNATGSSTDPGIDFNTSSASDMQIRYRGATDLLQIYSYGTTSNVVTIKKSDGKVGIGNTSPLGKLTISNAAGNNAPNTITAANTYLQLGSDDYGPNNDGKFMIGFGYTDATNTNSPAYIGFEETSTSGDTKGNLTFYTRDVITDTAPSKRMTITPTGDVGIGTTSPSSILHIEGNTNEYASAPILYFGSTSTANAAVRDWAIGPADDNYGNFHIFRGTSTGSNPIGTAGRVFTISSSGNVGIGTTSPVEKLHVEGSMLLDAYNVGAEEGLFFRQGFSSSNKYNLGIMTYAHNGSTNDGLTIGAYNGFSVSTGSNSRQERMRITNAGNVGIGTSSPGTELQVGDYTDNLEQITIATASDQTGRINFYNANNTEGASIRVTGGGLGAKMYFANRYNTDADKVTFDLVNGRVGIGAGMTSPERTLDVNGVIHSQGVVGGGGGQLFMKCSNANSSDDGLFGRIKSLNNGGTTMASIESRSEGSGNNAAHWEFFTHSGSAIANRMRIRSNGTVQVFGALSKGSGSFEIAHPLESKKDTHLLRHSFIEGPQCDNIYRGTIDLVSGTATVDLDAKFTMTNGTFVALNRNVQVFTTNETDWDNVKGSIVGNVLTITCQNNNSTAKVSWLVVGERQDDNIKSSEITNNEGKLILEPEVYEGGT